MNNNQVLEYKIINSNKVLVKHKSFRTHRETQQVLINFQTIILSQYHAQMHYLATKLCRNIVREPLEFVIFRATLFQVCCKMAKLPAGESTST